MLQRTLPKRKGWRDVHDYADGRSGLAACLADPPDLLLVDLNLPGLHGMEVVKQLRERSATTKVLVLTGHADPKLPSQLMNLGVAGFVDKTAPLAYVLQAIDTVMAGGMFFAANVQAESGPNASNLPLASEASPDVLSPREIEVARLVARGRSSKEIASDLDLSRNGGEAPSEYHGENQRTLGREPRAVVHAKRPGLRGAGRCAPKAGARQPR